MKYLIVECIPLNDQYECEADRIPLRVVDDYSDYQRYGYDIHRILPDGTFECIQDYYDYEREEY